MPGLIHLFFAEDEMKFFVLLLLLLVTAPGMTAYSKSKSDSKKKIQPEDAKELCLITLGASISDFELSKCIEKVLKTGKVK